MLYDPKWEAKADPFTLQNLIAWLEQQPARREYCYAQHGDCLLAQYLSAHGFQKIQVYSCGSFTHEDDEGEKWDRYPDEWDTVALKWPRTFDGALRRARTLQPALASAE